MLDLDATYEQLAHYREANRRGAQTVQDIQKVPDRPISLLATGITASASVSRGHPRAPCAAHERPRCAGATTRQTAGKNAADVLHRCHLALELDGRAHDYAAHEWLPVVYDVAAPLLESARLDRSRRRSSSTLKRPFTGWRAL